MSISTSFFNKLKAALASIASIPLHDLLARGYFPAELPPPFETTSFADKATAQGPTLPIEFTKKKDTWCDYTPFSPLVSKTGN